MRPGDHYPIGHNSGIYSSSLLANAVNVGRGFRPAAVTGPALKIFRPRSGPTTRLLRLSLDSHEFKHSFVSLSCIGDLVGASGCIDPRDLPLLSYLFLISVSRLRLSEGIILLGR